MTRKGTSKKGANFTKVKANTECVATCQCRCGWERTIISADTYRVKRLQRVCLKAHKRVCQIAVEDNLKVVGS